MLGSGALQVLARAGLTGSVHSVFPNTVNLVFEDRIVSLQNHIMPKTPLTLAVGHEVCFPDLGLNVGDRVTVNQESFNVKEYRFQFCNAYRWEARLLVSFSTPEQIALLSKSVFEAISLMGPRTGFGELGSILYAATAATVKPGLTSPLLAAAMPVLQALDEVVDTGKEREWVPAATTLVGLGTGLTPSGDDFLIGFLSILALMEERNRRTASFASALRSTIKDALFQTTSLSREFFRCACTGEYSEPFHELYTAAEILDEQKTLAAAIRFAGIGHTSGVDSLTGILYGLRFCCRLLHGCLPGDLGR